MECRIWKKSDCGGDLPGPPCSRYDSIACKAVSAGKAQRQANRSMACSNQPLRGMPHMARRRLHGETQKRRRKKQTQTLKRNDRVQRPETTQRPAAFELAGVIESQDIAFLEAMRELGVQPIPRPGKTPERVETAARVLFEESEVDTRMFGQAMKALGVRPLAPQSPKNGKQGAKPHLSGSSDISGAATPAPATASPPVTATPPAPPARTNRKETVFTRFELPDHPEAMAELFSIEHLDTSRKYEGAPAPSRPAEPTRPAGLPDAELDLHGKTQEEALRMVTNFLMSSHRQRLRHVLIITGKGNRSGPGGPVLKGAVEAWLTRNGKPFARAFRSAPPEHGGSGAIWVDMR